MRLGRCGGYAWRHPLVRPWAPARLGISIPGSTVTFLLTEAGTR